MGAIAYRKRRVALPHLDAMGAAVFARQLEDIDREVYNYEYPELIAETLIPTKTDLPLGADWYGWRGYSRAGIAKILAQYSDDIPRVDVMGEEKLVRVHPLGDSWGTNIAEIENATLPGASPINAEKAITAREAIQELLETIAAVGDSAFGLYGLTNQPNAQSVTIPAGAAGGSTTAWDSGKTDDEILADLNAMPLKAVDTTRNRAVPNTLVLPTYQYGYLAGRRLSDGSGQTILQFWIATNPWIKTVLPWDRLKTAGTGGTTRAVAFRREPRFIKLITSALRTLDPQQERLEIINILLRKTAGVVAPRPLAIVTADGI